MLAGLICRVVGHRINRRRVKHDRIAFHTRCKRCKTHLVREAQGWRQEA